MLRVLQFNQLVFVSIFQMRHPHFNSPLPQLLIKKKKKYFNGSINFDFGVLRQNKILKYMSRTILCHKRTYLEMILIKKSVTNYVSILQSKIYVQWEPEIHNKAKHFLAQKKKKKQAKNFGPIVGDLCLKILEIMNSLGEGCNTDRKAHV